jgi:hypothetical protein
MHDDDHVISELQQPRGRARCSSPMWYMSMENKGGMISILVSDMHKLGEGDEFSLQSIFVHWLNWLLRALKSYDMGRRLYFPSEGTRAAEFYRP